MAVTNTPNLGLAKPDIDEIANRWAKIEEWNKDNNNSFLANIPDDVDYTPVLTSDGTNPSIGTGSNAASYGRYIILPGNFVMGWFVFRCNDPGVSAGSGRYIVNLPIDIDTSFHIEGTSVSANSGEIDVIGEAFLRDDSNPLLSQSCALDVLHFSGVSYARFNTEAYSGKTTSFFAAGSPFTLATNDRVSGNFFYKAA